MACALSCLRVSTVSPSESARTLSAVPRAAASNAFRALGEHRQHILADACGRLDVAHLLASSRKDERIVHHVVDACPRVLQPMRPRRLLLLRSWPHILLCLLR